MAETRKLAAFLRRMWSDSASLPGSDEEPTLARLRALRSDLIDPTITVHNVLGINGRPPRARLTSSLGRSSRDASREACVYHPVAVLARWRPPRAQGRRIQLRRVDAVTLCHARHLAGRVQTLQDARKPMHTDPCTILLKFYGRTNGVNDSSIGPVAQPDRAAVL
jgi:hypothetical protein